MNMDVTVYFREPDGACIDYLTVSYVNVSTPPRVGDEISIDDEVWENISKPIMQRFYDEEITVKSVVWFLDNPFSVGIYCDIFPRKEMEESKHE